MYVDDCRSEYPYFFDETPSVEMDSGRTPYWYDFLRPYQTFAWTNQAFHCPAYNAYICDSSDPAYQPSGSYAYNRDGTETGGGSPSAKYHLGLGNERHAPGGTHGLLKPTSESQVHVPSEMFAMSDSRRLQIRNFFDSKTNLLGYSFMWQSYLSSYEYAKLTRPHGSGFNVLFCDGHVALIPRRDYIDPKRTARNWNNDHELHPETWTNVPSP